MRTVPKDPGFTVSASAVEAQHAAINMLEALDDDHNTESRSIVEKLVNSLSTCTSAGRDRMWGLFYTTRTSPEFLSTWDKLMSLTLGKPASPIFFQYISDLLFKELVKHKYPLPATTLSKPLPAMNYEEHNAVRYAAGYVVRRLRQRLERGSHPRKEEMVLSLVGMCEDDSEDDCSTDWTKAIDRGGLNVVNDKTYRLFLAMEKRLREFFRLTSAQSISDGMKSTLVKTITEDEDVLFFWTILAAEWEQEEETTLLPMVIELWLTIRGFSFCKSYLEMYKQASKKTVQKSKGLRKKLYQ